MMPRDGRPRWAWHGLGVALVLGAVGWLSPAPYPTDQVMMEQVGQGVIVPGCADLNCFRILVPAILEHLPGPSLVRWRTFAVVANAGAALAAGQLALTLGLSSGVAVLTVWLSGLTAGSMGTIHHPYNADPFVLMLAPIVTGALLTGRRRAAGVLATVGVFAKEFAAAPLFIDAGAAGLRRDWAQLRRGLLLAGGVTAVWACLQAGLMAGFHYSYNANPSAQPLSGGYLMYWWQHVTVAQAASAIYGAYGALYLALPMGLVLAPRALRGLAIAAVPAAAAFVYVATPERAIGNFFYLVVPLAALVLSSLPAAVTAVFVACFGLANLRIGAQIPGVPASRYALLATSAIAAAALWTAWRSRRPQSPYAEVLRS